LSGIFQNPDRMDSTVGLYRNLLFSYLFIIIEIFCHTADTVSTHFPSGPIRIIHFHPAVCHIGRTDQNHSVPSNAKMAVTDFSRQGLRIYDLLFFLIQDRKSTRLNSSHVSISYAVFCLKKKKQSSIEKII